MLLSIEQVIGFGPCTDNFPYRDPSYIRGLFGGKDAIEHREVLEIEAVPSGDKVWVLLQLLNTTLNKERDLRLFACDCAERALNREREAGREPDRRSYDAVKVVRRFAVGEATEEERSAAATHAYAAAATATAAYAHAAYAYAEKRAEREWQAERLCHYLDNATTEG